MTDFEQDMEDDYQDGYEKSLDECKRRSKSNMTNSDVKGEYCAGPNCDCGYAKATQKGSWYIEQLEKQIGELQRTNEALIEACRRAEQVLGSYQSPVLKALHSIMSQAIANDEGR